MGTKQKKSTEEMLGGLLDHLGVDSASGLTLEGRLKRFMSVAGVISRVRDASNAWGRSLDQAMSQGFATRELPRGRVQLRRSLMFRCYDSATKTLGDFEIPMTFAALVNQRVFPGWRTYICNDIVVGSSSTLQDLDESGGGQDFGCSLELHQWSPWRHEDPDNLAMFPGHLADVVRLGPGDEIIGISIPKAVTRCNPDAPDLSTEVAAVFASEQTWDWADGSPVVIPWNYAEGPGHTLATGPKAVFDEHRQIAKDGRVHVVTAQALSAAFRVAAEEEAVGWATGKPEMERKSS